MNSKCLSEAAKNSSMNNAKRNKNNEFFTHIRDIEDEIISSGCYNGCFEGKVVLCNCGDLGKSAFRRFFVTNFSKLGLKRLITVSYGDSAKVGVYDGDHTRYYPLAGNGDFRSDEGVKILNHADIVVTNPPFSLFRAFVAQLMEYNKQFLIIGNEGSLTCKNVFPLFMEGKMRFGHSTIKIFDTPDDVKEFGFTRWFTNIGIKQTPAPLNLTKTYLGHEDEYPKYDNFDAIEVRRVRDIPYDYKGLMGVPITFLEKCCPAQFEIVGEANHGTDSKYDLCVPLIQGYDVGRRLIIKNLMVVGLDSDLSGPMTENGIYRQSPGRFYINGERKQGRVVVSIQENESTIVQL